MTEVRINTNDPDINNMLIFIGLYEKALGNANDGDYFIWSTEYFKFQVTKGSNTVKWINKNYVPGQEHKTDEEVEKALRILQKLKFIVVYDHNDFMETRNKTNAPPYNKLDETSIKEIIEVALSAVKSI
jgi:hypothetical protein